MLRQKGCACCLSSHPHRQQGRRREEVWESERGLAAAHGTIRGMCIVFANATVTLLPAEVEVDGNPGSAPIGRVQLLRLQRGLSVGGPPARGLSRDATWAGVCHSAWNTVGMRDGLLTPPWAFFPPSPSFLLTGGCR